MTGNYPSLQEQKGYTDGTLHSGIWLSHLTDHRLSAWRRWWWVEGVKDQALQMGLIDCNTWDQDIADLYTTAGEGGTFSYTFFKGVATR